jgi:hypothetical protein
VTLAASFFNRALGIQSSIININQKAVRSSGKCRRRSDEFFDGILAVVRKLWLAFFPASVQAKKSHTQQMGINRQGLLQNV